MKKIIINSLLLIGILLLTAGQSSAQGYGYYSPPPPYGYAYNYQPQYYYPRPPAYGRPHYPFYDPYRDQQTVSGQARDTASMEKSTETKITSHETPGGEIDISTTKPETKGSKLKKPNNSDDFSDKKQKFIALLLPHIEHENERILAQRNWLINLSVKNPQGLSLSQHEQEKLNSLLRDYKIQHKEEKFEVIVSSLLTRVDIIPASLTLAQAANESGWGKSRFAREANNYFGIWTYDEEKGLIPRKRSSGKNHFVRKFKTAGESVSYYMNLLNTHPAYDKLRNIRLQLRQESKEIQGKHLVPGLEKYSAKGPEYIKLITQLIFENQWTQLDNGQAAINT